MGWCHEFGAQVGAGCDHPMEAGTAACTCAECGVACGGKFAGCDLVWARGPRPVVRVAPPRPVLAAASNAAATVDPAEERPDDVSHLVKAIEALRDDVAALAAAVASRTEALDRSSARLAELVEGLPLRIGAAVQAAMGAPGGNGARPAPVPAAPTPPPGEPPAGDEDWDALRSRLAPLTQEPPAGG